MIENYREMPPGGFCIALFDVYLAEIGLIFRNVKLCIGKRGTHFIGYPSFATEHEETGEKKWIQFFQFSPEKKVDFENKIFEEIAPFVRGPIKRFSKD